MANFVKVYNNQHAKEIFGGNETYWQFHISHTKWDAFRVAEVTNALRTLNARDLNTFILGYDVTEKGTVKVFFDNRNKDAEFVARHMINKIGSAITRQWYTKSEKGGLEDNNHSFLTV